MRRTATSLLIAILGFVVAPSSVVGQTKQVEYYHLDALGSVRVVTDATGHEIERHDFLPFGEEWCGQLVCGGATPGQPPRFTGKERDPESALDYFGARYYASRAGRFTTVDPAPNIEAALTDPQRWNQYVYARNNPLVFTDPDGRDLYRVTTPWEQQLMRMAGAIRDRVATALGANSTAPQHPLGVFGRSVVDTLLGTFLPRNVEDYASNANATILGMAIPLPAITATTRAAFLEAALAEERGGVSAAGRALQSHASREGSWLADLAQGGNAAENTKVAKGILEMILDRGRITLGDHPTFGKVIRVRLPDGSGAWWTATGEWIGFLERYTPK